MLVLRMDRSTNLGAITGRSLSLRIVCSTGRVTFDMKKSRRGLTSCYRYWPDPVSCHKATRHSFVSLQAKIWHFFPEVSIVLWVYLDILDGLPTNVPWEHASTKAATHWRIWVHSIEKKKQNSLSWGWTGRRGSTGEKSWTRRYSLGDSLAQLTVLLMIQIYNSSLMLPTMGSYFQFNSNKLVDNAQPCRT